ncbi:hypothetical protein BXZ70DRAFT_514961 [Cristinia sonorae]|uniref:DH domain-containing protein n=1 Tax=Cristinia sonorae TaxID=1940300 RepID=A0A8K0UW84_9AGAR|nr:hypothetical protein BXZ70DRAFT_514961 [Cristinia sonorae]
MQSYRSKSRSPAVGNTPIQATSQAFPSRTPTFQPPSFYAAAANYEPSYTKRIDDQNYSNSYPVPLSYPTQQPQYSAESAQVGGTVRDASGATRNRSSSLSRSLSRAKGGHSDKDKGDGRDAEQARYSQFVDLPLLETQLLPSLRDTIDRMTHPQLPNNRSRQDASPHVVPTKEDQPSYNPHYTSYSPAGPGMTSPPSGSSAAKSPRYQSSSRARTETAVQSPPVATQGTQYMSSSIPQDSPNYAKSALRTPASKTRLPSPAVGSTSRTVRYTPSDGAAAAMDEYKVSGSLKPPMLSPTTVHMHQTSSRSQTPHQYSQRDDTAGTIRTPSIPDQSYARPPKSTPTTPRHPVKSPRPLQSVSPAVSRHERHTPRSGIPRLNGATIPGTTSDLAEEYGKRFTGGRLVVTNGFVTTSSSEGDGTDSESNSLTQWAKSHSPGDVQRTGPPKHVVRAERHDNGGDQYSRTQSRAQHTTRTLGLGLSMVSQQQGHVQQDWDASEDDHTTESEDAYEPYEWQDNQRAPERQRGSTPRGARDHSPERRRQDALAGLVNGLDAQFGYYPAAPGRSRLSQGEGEANTSSVGLAIGDTGDLQRDSMGISREIGNVERSPHHIQETPIPYDDVRRHRAVANDDSTSRRWRDQTRRKAEDASGDHQDYRRSVSQPPTRRSPAVPSAKSPMIQQSHYANPEQDVGGPPYADYAEKDRSKRTRRRVSMSAGRSQEAKPSRRSPPEVDPRIAAARTPAPKRSNLKTTTPVEAAAREREGFGIPRSLSFCGNDGADNVQSGASRHDQAGRGGNIPHVDSDLSTIAGKWDEQAGNPELSKGAEALFRNLSGRSLTANDQGRKHRRRGMTVEDAPIPSAAKSAQHHTPVSQVTRTRHSHSLSEASSVPSVYEEQPTPPMEHHEQPANDLDDGAPEGWRSTMSANAYHDLLAAYGPIEMRRQNAIYELFSAEDTFTSQLRMILRQFIRPLRHKDSKQWIPGVPAPITRLFDWFDDIINLHLGLAIAMKTARRVWREGGVIIKLTDIFVGVTPRLEIYQPYLARIQSVTDALLRCESDGTSEFGEFVKIRQQEPECGGWTLAQLLHEPVKHIQSYPDALLRILQLTPRGHPDHLAMLSLYHSFRMVMRVMEEVRAREEAYESFKRVTSEIEGLLPSFHLANRERRLLWKGPLVVNQVPDDSERLGTPQIVISPAPDRFSGQAQRTVSTGPVNEPRQAQTFILNDLILFAVPVKKSRRREGKPWRLLEGTGAAKLLGFRETRSESDNMDGTVLDLLPISGEDIDTGANSSKISCLQVMLPQGDQRKDVIQALQRCNAETIRSLAFPSGSDTFPRLGPNDLELDTQHSLAAITSTGLPMPKSPSVQLQEVYQGTAGNAVEQEREERGWWSLRFQQVLGEMRRQDPMISLSMSAAR